MWLGFLDGANMLADDLLDLAKGVAKIVAVAAVTIWTFASLVLAAFPWNYVLALFPLGAAVVLANREEARKILLGFVHDRPREVSAERVQKALDEIERDLKKTRPLP